jgi:small subunit ribosomal protein S2
MALDSIVVIRELLENGVHFGHQTNKWNPKMEPYIFGEKGGIYIIDLKKTEEALAKAIEFLYGLTASGKTALFVGTKKQAKQIIREEAQRCGMFFVDERWLGGCLTNFSTIRKSVERLNQLQERKKSDIYASLAKKEKARIDREEYKLLKNLEGIREMKELPHCLIVIDAEAEGIAIREGYKMGIPVVALVDTNCDPAMIRYTIPGNDDAIRSIKYIVSKLADAAEKGHNEFMGKKTVKEKPKVEEKKAPEKAPVEVEEKKPEAPHEEAEKEEAAPESAEEEIIEGDIKLDEA